MDCPEDFLSFFLGCVCARVVQDVILFIFGFGLLSVFPALPFFISFFAVFIIFLFPLFLLLYFFLLPLLLYLYIYLLLFFFFSSSSSSSRPSSPLPSTSQSSVTHPHTYPRPHTRSPRIPMKYTLSLEDAAVCPGLEADGSRATASPRPRLTPSLSWQCRSLSPSDIFFLFFAFLFWWVGGW